MNPYIRACLTVVALLVAAPVAAQDPLQVVRDVKAQVLAAGIDLDRGPGECGRFEITRRVGIALAGAGRRVGLIAKFGAQNKCADGAQPPREDGFAVDALMEPDGTVIDILCGGHEGRDTPCWLIQPTKTRPELWRSPFVGIADTPDGDPTDVGEPDEAPTPDGDSNALVLVQGQLEDIMRQITALRDEVEWLKQHELAEHQRTRDEIKAFRESAKKATNKALEILPAIIGGLGLIR